MRKLYLYLGALVIVFFTILAVASPVLEGAAAEPQPSSTSTTAVTTTTVPTVVVGGKTYTQAQIEAWVAAVERHERDVMLRRLGALKGGIKALPGDSLDRYLPEIRSHAIQVDRRGVTSVVVSRVTHIEAKYVAEVRQVWINIARLAAWHKAEQARRAAAAYPSGQCGGDLPPCYVMRRESGGDIHAQNPRSTASGKWQFLDSTWAGYGGYAKARYAPEKVQDAKARLLWDRGRGCSHWSAC